MAAARKSDNKRLFWITLALLFAGLAGALWIQAHAGLVARKTGALPDRSTPSRAEPEPAWPQC